MATITVGRETKRDYQAVRYFAASEQPEKEQSDEQGQQPAEQPQPDGETAQARQEAEQPAEQAQEQAPKEKKVPVAKQPRKKGGKR